MIGVPNFNSDALNIEVTETEIRSYIKNLKKNGKCPGTDEIINEHINILICPVTSNVKLFNMIPDTGNTPESWFIGVIKPLYKNKGDPAILENYRPILKHELHW